MITIVRGRDFSLDHTVMDTEEGPETQLAEVYTGGFCCQLRERWAKVSSPHVPRQALVKDIPVSIVEGCPSLMRMSLTATETRQLPLGMFILDIVGRATYGDEALLDPETVSITDYPTNPH